MWVVAYYLPDEDDRVRVVATESRDRVEAVTRTKAFLLAAPEQRDQALAKPQRWLDARPEADLEAFAEASEQERAAWPEDPRLIGVRTDRRAPDHLAGQAAVAIDVAASDPEWAAALAERVTQDKQLRENASRRVEAGYFGFDDDLAVAGRWWREDEQEFSKRPTDWVVAGQRTSAPG